VAGTVSMSVLSTQYVQCPVTIQSPAGYDPTGNTVAFAFMPLTYPETTPGSGDWHTGSWQAFPGPVYWAQCLVGPANSGVSLAQGTYMVFVRVTDNPEVPVLQPFMIQITP